MHSDDTTKNVSPSPPGLWDPMFAVSKELLQRLKSAACQLFLEIHVALIACDQLPEDFANTAVPARELNHPIRERRSPEISIETTAHLRGAL